MMLRVCKTEETYTSRRLLNNIGIFFGVIKLTTLVLHLFGVCVLNTILILNMVHNIKLNIIRYAYRY